jgi:hypothetical protein
MLNASLYGTESGQRLLSRKFFTAERFELQSMELWLSRGRSEAPYLRDIVAGLHAIGLTMQGVVTVDEQGSVVQVTSAFVFIRIG